MESIPSICAVCHHPPSRHEGGVGVCKVQSNYGKACGCTGFKPFDLERPENPKLDERIWGMLMNIPELYDQAWAYGGGTEEGMNARIWEFIAINRQRILEHIKKTHQTDLVKEVNNESSPWKSST